MTFYIYIIFLHSLEIFPARLAHVQLQGTESSKKLFAKCYKILSFSVLASSTKSQLRANQNSSEVILVRDYLNLPNVKVQKFKFINIYPKYACMLLIGMGVRNKMSSGKDNYYKCLRKV